jgi:hypothetical protein
MRVTFYLLSLLLSTSFFLGSCTNSQGNSSAQVNNNTQSEDIDNQPIDGNLSSKEVLINGLPVRYVYSNTFNLILSMI